MERLGSEWEPSVERNMSSAEVEAGGCSKDDVAVKQAATDEEFYAAVTKVFQQLDKDKSGSLNAHELKQFFKRANNERSLQRRKTASELLKQVNHQNISWCLFVCRTRTETNECCVFDRYFDDNNDGTIDVDEFRNGMDRIRFAEGGSFCNTF